MSIIDKPSIYYENVTISETEAEDLMNAQLLKELLFTANDKPIRMGVRMYVDNIRSITNTVGIDAERFHYIAAVKTHLSTILGANKLYPTPQLSLLHQADDNDYITSNKNAIVIGSTEQHKKTPNVLKLVARNSLSTVEVMNINCLWMPENFVRKLIRTNKDQPLVHYPSLRSLKYMSGLSATNNEIREMQKTLAQFSQIQPSTLAYFLVMPSRYFDSDKGIDSIIRNYVRHGAIVKDVETLKAVLTRMTEITLKDPTVRRIERATDKLNQILNYVRSNEAKLNVHLNREWMELNAANYAYQISHFEMIENTIVQTKTSGLIRVNPHEWITSANLSLNCDEKNARYHNLLPEVKGYDLNKNRNDKIKNSASLVGNCSVTEIPPAVLFNSVGMAQSTQIDSESKIYKGKSRWRDMGPSISYHQVSLGTDIVFNGYFDGVPTFDNNFAEKLMDLMENEFAAKLSGIQFKLPMLLSIHSDKLELARQRDNEPFTHIAKMPMPNAYEDITLAEWLALHIIDTSGVYPTANTTLVSFDKEHGQEYLIEPSSSHNKFIQHLSPTSEALRDEIEQIFSKNV
jgi:hypothetical protein